MITTAGLVALRRYFAGYDSKLADTIAIGLGGAAGETMQCEWFRFPIDSVGTDTDNGYVIFKSAANINVIGKVYEVGLMQGAGGTTRDITLSRFTSDEEAWIGNFSFTPTNARLGEGLKITSANTAYTVINPTGLNTTNEKDQLVLAGFAASAGTVKVTLDFDNGATVQATFNVPNGYGFSSVNRSDMVRTGAVDWNTVTKITINPSVDYTADLLKFKITNPWNEILIARTVLATPFTTDVTLPLEIEYPLGVRSAV